MPRDVPRRIISTDPSEAALPLAGRALLRRVFAWAVVVICVALLIGTAGELWTRHTIEVQAAAVRSSNAALRQDVATTRRTITVAESPVVIEREARSWGYIRPGDHPVIIVTSVPGN